ncbi:MOSC domain-containing protein [Chitinophaga rhizophila]|uniref:MOSC domain-containing protein n=1 Tax=Chitinophaga rhizophila TaxID=2866212 RepID=A0ABS7GD30_9BACT|nr:MOSC N-terminal beta barrel domain-containing protein [Chitinophaga rhizophila]MBW8685578.1 MOSC domain-containing protein [Chitinophaga rhizophila]
MLQVSQLFIYPVKSLGGIALDKADITDRGFLYDRRWMLIDDNNRFLTQREHYIMALFKLQLQPDGIAVRFKDATFTIPFEPQTNISEQVVIWNDTCTAIIVSEAANQWFSERMQLPCRLVYMPDNAHRQVETDYAQNGEIVSFADAYPFLLIGQASLDELNSRLEQPVPINRFRPNIVFTGGSPYQEDEMHQFTIGNVTFYGVKPCGRCVMTTVDQQTASKGQEPLRTLAGYRTSNKKVLFGQNLLHNGQGVIHTGDILHLIE